MITAAEIKVKYPHHLENLEVGDGWVGLVDEFIQAVFAHYEKIGRSELESSFKLMLAHQKYGQLRLRETSDVDIEEIIDFFERKSFSVCEECGEPGKLHVTLGYWHTICDSHKGCNSLRPAEAAKLGFC